MSVGQIAEKARPMLKGDQLSPEDVTAAVELVLKGALHEKENARKEGA